MFEISKNQIWKAIKALKTRKSPGNDGITAEVLKVGGEKMAAILDKIFRKVLTGEDTASEWSKMLVTPIHKKGDWHDTTKFIDK